jgi:hypothetical protein
MTDDSALPADDRPEVVLEPVEARYSEEYLEAVAAVQPNAPMGWVKAPHSSRAWSYADTAQHTLAEQGVVSVDMADPQVPAVRSAAKVKDRNVSLAKRTGMVRDQGFTPRCVCYSGASLRVFQERKEHKRTYEPDEDGWYVSTKMIDPWGPQVDGTGIEFACEVARNVGVVMDDSRTTKDGVGRNFKIGAYAAVNTVEEFLDALRHTPVWFGIDVDQGIFTPQRVIGGPADGESVVPPPNPSRQVGGHAMLAVGYWLSMGWLCVKQSWGASYGGVNGLGGGYFWMPLSHFTDDSPYTWDAWVVTDADDDFLLRAS